MARMMLQAMVDAVDTSLHTMTTEIFTCGESWLRSSGFLKEVQTIIEDVPFDESHLFNQKTNDSLHSL